MQQIERCASPHSGEPPGDVGDDPTIGPLRGAGDAWNRWREGEASPRFAYLVLVTQRCRHAPAQNSPDIQGDRSSGRTAVQPSIRGVARAASRSAPGIAVACRNRRINAAWPNPVRRRARSYSGPVMPGWPIRQSQQRCQGQGGRRGGLPSARTVAKRPVRASTQARNRSVPSAFCCCS